MFDNIKLPTVHSTYHIVTKKNVDHACHKIDGRTMHNMEIEVCNPDLARIEEIMKNKILQYDFEGWRHNARRYFTLHTDMVESALQTNNCLLRHKIDKIGLMAGPLLPLIALYCTTEYTGVTVALLVVFAGLLEYARRLNQRIEDAAAFVQHLRQNQEARIVNMWEMMHRED
jgi:hypothetical protein